MFRLSGQLFIISTRNAAILIQMLQQFFSPLLQCQFEVGELGFFSLSLKCDKAVANKKDIRSPSVHFQNVNLRIGSKFRNRFQTMELERKASPYISHSKLHWRSGEKNCCSI